MRPAQVVPPPPTVRTRSAVAVMVAVPLLVVTVFAVARVTTDVPHLLAGTLPAADTFERRYVQHPVVFYAHIAPGMLFLFGAPLQLWPRLRHRHPTVHRRLGRGLLGAGLLAGVLALVIGPWLAWGGPVESAATLVFGVWFLVALVLAFRAIRGGDVVRHRRFMIRAFAVGLAVGTIRIWLGLFQALGLLSFRESFGPAFWLAFGLHVLVAELYLRRRPMPPGLPTG